MSAKTGEKAQKTGDFLCQKCHQTIHVEEGRTFPRCPNCGHDTFGARIEDRD